MLTRLSCTTALGLICGVALAGAQAPAPAPPQGTPPPPEVTFRVEVNYVEQDVRVVDRNGSFVRGLKQEDFQVAEDGKPQRIQVFGMVDIPVVPTRRPLFMGPDAMPIEPDVASNKQVIDGRLYLIVLDDYHVAPLRTHVVRNLARRFVLEKLGPDDQAAVVVTSGYTKATQPFTQNRRLLIEAIENFQGQKLQSAAVQKNEARSRDEGNRKQLGEVLPQELPDDEKYTEDIEGPERTHKARGSLNSLRSLSEWLSAVQGRRKAMVFISEGVDYNVYDIFNMGDHRRFTFESFNLIQQETWDAIQAASRSNVQIYPVDPRGMTNMGAEDIEISGLAPDILKLGTKPLFQELQTSQMNLRQLAEETGGIAAVGRNDLNQAFDRIVEENSSYYVLGYYSTNDRRDGRLRNISVKVAGYPDAQVTYRKRYAAPRGRAPKTTGKPLDAKAGITAELMKTMASPLPTTGLDLRVTAIPKKGVGKTTDVEVLIHTAGRDLPFSEQNGTFSTRINYSVALFNKEGKSAAAERPDVDLNLRPETHQRVLENGVRILRHYSVPPGRYQVRVVAQDGAKLKQGSAYFDVDVPDFTKDPLAISGIALAATVDRASYSPHKQGFDPFSGMLPGPPSALREFPSGSELAAFVEVYDNQPTPTHRIDISATVRADDGRTVFSNSEERSSEELHGTPGAFGYAVRIPMKGWAPGLYVLSIEAKSRLGNSTPVSRVIQFQVKEGK